MDLLTYVRALERRGALIVVPVDPEPVASPESSPDD
jgi:hypothetical protein